MSLSFRSLERERDGKEILGSSLEPGVKRTKNTSAREISSREGEREAGGEGRGGGGEGQVEGE